MKLTAIIAQLFNGFQAVALSTTGSTSLTLAQFGRLKTVRISADAGAGTWTREVYFPKTNRIAGDKIHVRLDLAASVNQTINFRDNDAAGTILLTEVGSGSYEAKSLFFTYDGTNWFY